MKNKSPLLLPGMLTVNEAIGVLWGEEDPADPPFPWVRESPLVKTSCSFSRRGITNLEFLSLRSKLSRSAVVELLAEQAMRAFERIEARAVMAAKAERAKSEKKEKGT